MRLTPSATQPDAGASSPAADLSAGVVVADTVTKLPDNAAGAVVVCGSHGGRYPGHVAACAGVRAVIFCDAGIGRDEAGVGALPYLAALGIAAAAVSHASCRIGDTSDMLARGRISRANAIAERLGVRAGMTTPEAVSMLRAAAVVSAKPPPAGEARGLVAQPGWRRIVLVDSAAMVEPGDAGQIIVTGSHGGLVGGKPAMALRVAGFAAVFNDAGVGIDQAGTGRLPALDARGIAAFTVSAASARIGEARSTFNDGIISAVNRTAGAMEAHVGMPARDILLTWANFSDQN